jgi:SAM-dependent methyltransferase
MGNDLAGASQQLLGDTATELMRFNARLGLRKLLDGVGYGRLLEYTRLLDSIELTAHSRLLDLGTGRHSIFPWFCAYRFGCETYVTDAGAYLERQRKVARRLPELRRMHEARRIVVETQDAAALTYPDNSFDVVTAVSTIEHIPGNGDTQAAREAYRVLRPGGVFALSVPVARGGPYWEQCRRGEVYGRKGRGEPVFFSRAYDEGTLRTRILEAAPFAQRSLEYWHDHNWYIGVWGRHVPFRNFLKHGVGWWLTRKSLELFAPAEQYAGSEAWLAMVVLRK